MIAGTLTIAGTGNILEITGGALNTQDGAIGGTVSGETLSVVCQGIDPDGHRKRLDRHGRILGQWRHYWKHDRGRGFLDGGQRDYERGRNPFGGGRDGDGSGFGGDRRGFYRKPDRCRGRYHGRYGDGPSGRYGKFFRGYRRQRIAGNTQARALTLSRTNSYSGGTTIFTGTLDVDGNAHQLGGTPVAIPSIILITPRREAIPS